MSKTICVFCSSSDALAAEYFRAAESLGRLLAEKQHTLVYGGSRVGLMGALAHSTYRHGGRVIGVSLEPLKAVEITDDVADELIVTQSMAERKAEMAHRADAFIALPGGFGTLDEMIEMLTLKQLHFHHKPLVFINIRNFFDPLLAFFEQMIREKFGKLGNRALYHVAADAVAALAYIETYQPPPVEPKWF